MIVPAACLWPVGHPTCQLGYDPHPLFAKESCLGRTRQLCSRELFCAVPLCLTQQQRDYKILNPLNSLKISHCTPSK